ncbi:TolB family protein [Caenimonas aquaedulcis]|uniref:PD40 domain-containing protein n=1 Tax=Caenimonas aquaedulcis TaxID=2793270 RepID=A0A931H7W8_9BURK|nr:PD40 domain-containing protein [Caenimonas aquaedulcis]MBG9390163.1 PD40 domain-containing protein [Caenimonas aquaedulcis]
MFFSKVPSALAAMAMACAAGAAHATYPGINGVIVFENAATHRIGRTAPTGGAVTDLAAGRSPAVSPNGRKIAFSLPNAANTSSAIHVMNIDGTNDVQLTSGTWDVAPAWSADGTSISFVRNQNEMWSINPDGTGAMNVRPLLGAVTSLVNFPHFTSKGSFAYASYDTAGTPWLYFSSIQPRNDTLLARNSFPTFSPDGLTYMGVTLSLQAVEGDIAGPNSHLVPTPGSVTGQNVISPDGKSIAAGVGNAQNNLLQVRPRSGGPGTVQWPDTVHTLDWSRLPQACHETTTTGGSSVSPSADFYASQCAVVVMPDGGQTTGVLMQAAAIGPDQRLYVATKKLDGKGVPYWSPFEVAPGFVGSPTVAYSAGLRVNRLAIAGAKDGSLQVVVVFADGTVYHNVRYAGGSWSAQGFIALYNGNNFFKARDVAITISGSSATSQGMAQVIANGYDLGSVFHRVRSSDGTWTDWAEVPGAAGLNTRQLAIAAGDDGNTNVLATVVQPDGTSLIKRQVRYTNSWDPSFVDVAIPAGTTLSALDTQIALTVTTGQFPTAQLVYTDVNGAAWLQQRGNPLYQSSWTGQTGNVSLATGGTRGVSISGKPNGVANSEVMLVRTSAQ